MLLDALTSSLQWQGGRRTSYLFEQRLQLPRVQPAAPAPGELLVKRAVNQFNRAYRRHDKVVCNGVVKLIAALVNQQLVHELLALQLCILLLETPTDDSVETVVTFVTECGAALAEVSPQALNSIFERLRSILHEGAIDKRVQYMIEGLYAVRKSNFADYPAVLPELDLVEAEDQITHEVSLDEQLDLEESLDYFTFDPDFEAQRTHHTPRAPPPRTRSRAPCRRWWR